MTRRSNGALAALATAGVLAGCGGSGGGPPRAITFDVTVPAGTTGTVEVVGSTAALGAWLAGSGLALIDVGGDRWTGTVEVGDEVDRVEYKYTRGSLLTIEKGEGCVELPNRQVAVADGTTVVTDEVVAWRDWCLMVRGPAVPPAAR